MSNFVTYNSSAGSGKTYTLVKEYLKIALETDYPHQYKHILAITFTNKAAAEMKQRIISSLQALSSGNELTGTVKFLLEDLQKPESEGGLGADRPVIMQRSRNVLKSILHNYNDFGVSTIDKFTHKIIRTFAHDLHLPLNFNIEIEEKDVLKASIDMLVAQVGTNEKLTRLLLEYTSKKAEAEESWNIENDLYEFSKKLLKEDGELHLKKLRNLSIEDFDSIKTQLYKETKTFENMVKLMGEQGMDLIRKKGIDPSGFSRSFFFNYWKDLATHKKYTPTDTTLKIIRGEANWYATTVDSSQKQLIDENQREFIQLFESSREYIDKFEGNYIVNKLIIKNLYNLAVLNEIEKTILEFKKENNVLNISDFNKRIASIVESEPTPFIYERLGEKFNHYLIDEFQDTSIIQWHNIIPLVENSLGNGNFNMVVGDAKQAIYRFRGGEVEQIINLPGIYKHNDNPLLIEREDALNRNYLEKNLTTNYRSKAEIVKFNNDFFQSVSKTLTNKYMELYSELTQEYNVENTGGGVSVFFNEDTDNEAYKLFILKNIFNIIKENQKAGYPLSDMAVLTRNNKDGAEVASYLLEHNINVVSSESLLLNSSEEVDFLTNVLRYLSFPDDKKHQLEVLSYLTDIFEDDLFEVFRSYPDQTFLNYIKSKNIAFSFRQIENYSLYELVEYLIVKFDLNKKIDVYIQFFLDKVHEYATRYDNSILNFLEWWNIKSDKFSIVIPEGVDAVRVMSIHKSKGLEFPVVIYPFADSNVKVGEDFFWADDTDVVGLGAAIIPMLKELENTRYASVYEEEINKSRLDLINLLYVALTRPKDRLYIISRLNKKPSVNGAVADYLIDFCRQYPDREIETHHYSFGLFNNKEQDKIVQTENEQAFDIINYNNWREKIQVSYEAPKIWDTQNPEAIGEYGTLIHNILSEIVHVNDMDKVLSSYLIKGLITKQQLPLIKTAINDLFKIPEVKHLFTDFDELKNERSILLPNASVYQPDRVVVKGEKTYLVDYKTGEKMQKHIDQLNNYKRLLMDMGYQNINAFLLYINERDLVRI